jgi:hypothetical protein
MTGPMTWTTRPIWPLALAETWATARSICFFSSCDTIVPPYFKASAPLTISLISVVMLACLTFW